jgi:O-antigen ligase
MIPARHIGRTELGGFYAFAAISLMSVLLAFALNITFLLAVPVLLLVICFTIINYKAFYFILMAMLPCSIEYSFPNGLSTDLPTEPLMAGLMMVTFALLLFRKTALPKGFLSNPLVVILMMHLFWIFICAVNSEMPVFSFKIFLAKLWYFVPFTILTGIVMRKGTDIKKWFWCIFIPLTALVVVTMFRHGLLYHFGFQEINKSVTPYFRNHVNYAAMMSIFFPFILWAVTWYRKKTLTHKMLLFSVLLYIAAIYLSFTRTAMLAVLGMVPVYFIIKWRSMRPVVGALIVFVAIGVSWLFYDNHYLRFAPTYKETIYHDDFSSHVSSTLAGKDASSMERVYRWIGAVRMSRERPWMGVGPGNFANFYKSYTILSFETYLSDNDERSTVHNYYLFMLSEQGWPGLIIFLVLTFAVFIYGEHIYSKMNNREDKRAVMVLLLVMFSIIMNLMLSDMLESDKVGPFFFMDIALLALFDVGALTMKTEEK